MKQMKQMKVMQPVLDSGQPSNDPRSRAKPFGVTYRCSSP